MTRSIHGKIEPRGPFLYTTAMATSQHVSRLKAVGLAVAPPVTVRALLDTGASGCALDFGVISRLNLIQTGKTLVHTSTTGPAYQERDQFDVTFFIGHAPPEIASYTVSVVGADLASEGFLALLGWDVLAKCILTCDGPSRSFRLDF